mgnify:CR=1 FL=1
MWTFFASNFSREIWDISGMMFPSSLTGFKEFCMSHKATVKRIKRRRRK